MGLNPTKVRTQRSRVRIGARSGAFALGDGRSDGRGAWSVRFRTLCANRCNDLGGVDALSAQQLSLVRRSVMLELSLEKLENDAATGGNVDLDVYTRASGTLMRLLKTLGLKKQTAKPAPSLNNWRLSDASRSDA